MARAVLLTGGNLGPVARNLEEARRRIGERVGTVVAASSMRDSEAWGFESDDRFLNQVLVVETALEPEQVLDACQRIESEMGRVRTPGAGYSSRTMDIDILFYENCVISTERLVVPHPRMEQRDFVLAPLEEVLPAFVHPVSGKTVRQLLAELKRRGGGQSV